MKKKQEYELQNKTKNSEVFRGKREYLKWHSYNYIPYNP